MMAMSFIWEQIRAALARGVQQCVIVGSQAWQDLALATALEPELRLFNVREAQSRPESLAQALQELLFDKEKAGLFIWLGDAGFQTMEAVMGALSFIASLPHGSGVVLDYCAERSSIRTATRTALDALASSVGSASSVKFLIQPQAVAVMLRGFGFRQIVDVTKNVPCGSHLVSALV
jgi:hypothetical protein